MPTRSEIMPKDPLLSLPTYRAMIQLEGGPWIELSGETELVLLEPAAGTDVHLQLDRGRIVLGTNNITGTFQVDFVDPWAEAGPAVHAWQLALKGPETVAGIELVAPWRPGRPTMVEAAVLLPRGEAEFRSDERTDILGGPVEVHWNTADSFADRTSLAAPPAWLEREEVSLQMSHASQRLEHELKPDTSVVLPLLEAATTTDRRETRLLATQCLGALGRLEPLIEAMGTLEKQDVRREAIRALRQYMARGPAQQEVLWQTLAAKFKDQERASAMIGLLRGYSDADARKAETYDQLLQLLSFSELPVRELAIDNLRELTGSQLAYSPDKPSDNAIVAWRRLIEERVSKGTHGRPAR